jgi:DNA replication licensing factor MCM4
MRTFSFPDEAEVPGKLEKYPQEVVPAIDQVLKDLMLEIADPDQRRERMRGVQGDEEIMGRAYKVRPFGLNAVHTREINPTGAFLYSPCHSKAMQLIQIQIS